MTTPIAPLAIALDRCRQARKLLGWTALELASRAGVDPIALVRFEEGHPTLPGNALAAVRRALEGGGIVLAPEEPGPCARPDAHGPLAAPGPPRPPSRLAAALRPGAGRPVGGRRTSDGT